MRINLASRSNPHKRMLQHWAFLLADEYQVNPAQAEKWIISDPKFVAEFMQSKTWKVQDYATPLIYESSISFGYVIDDECDQFIVWKLSQT